MLMYILKHSQIRRKIPFFVIFHIYALASKHPVNACFCGKHLHSHKETVPVKIIAERFQGRLICIIQQRVARKNTHCLAIDGVRCFSSSAKLIIVNGRKIIMDQRACVDHLDRSHKRFDDRFVPSEQAVCLKHQDRTKPFSSGFHAVHKSIIQCFGAILFFRQKRSDHILYVFDLFRHHFIKIL